MVRWVLRKKIQSGSRTACKNTQEFLSFPGTMKQKHLWKLKSWDRHKIPKPFTTIVESFGEPFHVPKETVARRSPSDLR